MRFTATCGHHHAHPAAGSPTPWPQPAAPSRTSISSMDKTQLTPCLLDMRRIALEATCEPSRSAPYCGRPSAMADAST
jgi:hypothetical protein